MIYVNPNKIRPKPDWIHRAKELTDELKVKMSDERAAFIKACRDETWGAPSLVAALQAAIGNKCWYSDVPLDGADPNVDHFRPKGSVREIDSTLQPTKSTSPGYWWLAFDYQNYRLTSMHANQRRVDEDTNGGKWDFFPVRGERAPELTVSGAITENSLALDPCSPSDVALLWFDPSGTPAASKSALTAEDAERVRITIWLYHLDKSEIHAKRAAHLDEIRKDLAKANAAYTLWKDRNRPSRQAKESFDQKIAEIREKIDDPAPFAGAKRCAIRTAVIDYPWIEEYHVI